MFALSRAGDSSRRIAGVLGRESGLAAWTWLWIAIMFAGIAARAAVPHVQDGAWADAWAHVSHVLQAAAAVLGTVIVVVQSALTAERRAHHSGTAPPR
jgi:hypothetical protein